MLISLKDEIFSYLQFVNEGEFEKAVKHLADKIFGPATIYVDVKKQVRGNDIITIPDAYLIDLTLPSDPQFYVIENEIVSHDPFKHVGIQLLKFATNFEEGKYSIRNFLMEKITKNPEMLKKLRTGQANSASRNIDNYLDSAIYKPFKAIVLIDEARSELHNVLAKINANISVLELKAYMSSKGSLIYQYDTLYDVGEDYGEIPKGDKIKQRERRKKRQMRRVESDTIIVPAREDGFKETFLGEDCWYEIRIGAAMKERIKYIAAYQTSPVSAVTHMAKIQDIKPYKNTGKYIVYFKGKAKRIKKIPIEDKNKSPQSPVYVKKDVLLRAKYLDDIF